MPRTTVPRQASAPRKRKLPTRRPAPAFDLEAFLPFQLSVVANRLSQSVGRAISQRFSLQIPEWRIVVVLGKYGPLSALEIARKTSMDKARVSRAQHRLVDLGLANMQPDEGDRRKVIVSLGPQGLRIYREMVPLAVETARQLLAGITPQRLEFLEDIMGDLFASTAGFEPDGSDEEPA
ncbi:MarR family winged helix-turn-helix transcriptional regulator [Variovorax sp. E3]|jgi:DNA-binding MarR family transcriptional regulator|uniref:MarR family winged helix-turn-helix transcriptional regulator n=1 Tax=Variovorax sp. E3 TaxID=1914993 RepID=UPI0018DB431A|nr:MarR family winged helix-turn-helix transcriptional regulator [Variovorax sp. E3]